MECETDLAAALPAVNAAIAALESLNKTDITGAVPVVPGGVAGSCVRTVQLYRSCKFIVCCWRRGEVDGCAPHCGEDGDGSGVSPVWSGAEEGAPRHVSPRRLRAGLLGAVQKGSAGMLCGCEAVFLCPFASVVFGCVNASWALVILALRLLCVSVCFSTSGAAR